MLIMPSCRRNLRERAREKTLYVTLDEERGRCTFSGVAYRGSFASWDKTSVQQQVACFLLLLLLLFFRAGVEARGWGAEPDVREEVGRHSAPRHRTAPTSRDRFCWAAIGTEYLLFIGRFCIVHVLNRADDVLWIFTQSNGQHVDVPAAWKLNGRFSRGRCLQERRQKESFIKHYVKTTLVNSIDYILLAWS